MSRYLMDKVLTKEEVGGGRLSGEQMAIITSATDDGQVKDLRGTMAKALRNRGLMANGRLSEKGLLVRKKLKGLG